MEMPTDAEPVKVVEGDCLDVLSAAAADSFDSVCTDPPYGLEFMGKEWDQLGGGRIGAPGIGSRDVPWVSNRGWNSHRCRVCGHLPHGGSPCKCESPDIRPIDNRWQEMQGWYRLHFSHVLRVLKPGGYMVAFGGTRTYHRLTCAIEDAGFEIRDCLMWLYGTGFPKGRGCLKPAWEPIVLARKPGKRVLPLGVDACRVPLDPACNLNAVQRCKTDQGRDDYRMNQVGYENPTYKSAGRYPANVLHDGSDEVMEAFAAFGDRGASGKGGPPAKEYGQRNAVPGELAVHAPFGHDALGTAARFFYCAKASKADRGEGNTHPTVKPLALMRWLVRLVAPPGGTVLDPFAGSGTTLLACAEEGRRAVGVERHPPYAEIIRKRLAARPPDLLAGVA